MLSESLKELFRSEVLGDDAEDGAPERSAGPSNAESTETDEPFAEDKMPETFDGIEFDGYDDPSLPYRTAMRLEVRATYDGHVVHHVGRRKSKNKKRAMKSGQRCKWDEGHKPRRHRDPNPSRRFKPVPETIMTKAFLEAKALRNEMS